MTRSPTWCLLFFTDLRWTKWEIIRTDFGIWTLSFWVTMLFRVARAVQPCWRKPSLRAGWDVIFITAHSLAAWTVSFSSLPRWPLPCHSCHDRLQSSTETVSRKTPSSLCCLSLWRSIRATGNKLIEHSYLQL